MVKPLNSPLDTLNPTLKNFLRYFNIAKPVWDNFPDGFPNCDLKGLTTSEVGSFNAIRALWEMQKPVKIESRSRIWTDPKGYQYLGVWQNAALLRVLIRKFTLNLTLKHPYELRLKAQMDDTARSVKRNIEEGFKRPTTSEYLQFLGYSQASLEELKGDVYDAKTDGFLPSKPSSTLMGKGIDLRVIKGPEKGKAWGEPSEKSHPYFLPLTTLNPKTLTYEILLELVNKTDWLLRKLVESLEVKLNKDQKNYQVESLRIKQRI